MSIPHLSIIVPVYNVEKYLDRCVQSLIQQSLTEIEIILVDDGSPDNCPKMCDEWVKKDSRIKVIHKKNEGLGYARNSGLEVATGEYVTFIDSDDYVDRDAYKQTYIEAVSSNLDVCYFRYRRVTQDGKKYEVCHDKQKYYRIGRKEVDAFMLNLVGRDPNKPDQVPVSVSVCMAIFKRSIIQESNVRFVSEKEIASEDLIFDIQFLPYVNRIGVIPEVFYNYFINTSSISTSYSEDYCRRLLRLLSFIKPELLKIFSWEDVKNHYYSQQLRVIKIILKYESKVTNRRWYEKIVRIKKVCGNDIFTEMLQDRGFRDRLPFVDKSIIFMLRNNIIALIVLVYQFRGVRPNALFVPKWGHRFRQK